MKRVSFLPLYCPLAIVWTFLPMVLALTFGPVAPAAAQPSNTIKWDQPPALAVPTNIYYGWNQLSVMNNQVAADDWVCTSANPVTKIRWWGSFIGWTQSVPPPVLPFAFKLHFWSDVPKGPGVPFSHPGQVLHEIICTNFTFRCVGQDYDPRTGTFETCFLFEQSLTPNEWFYQNPLNGTNIYWLSIAAEYPAGQPLNNPFGWKTRQRDPTSPAPDAAVTILNPNYPVPGSIFGAGFPILWPAAGASNEWDLAFELIASGTGGSKWEQVPDLAQTGMDVDATRDPQAPGQPRLLADDFLCVQPGLITNIVVWGSWTNDILPFNDQGLPDPSFVMFTLSIHADIPDPDGPNGTNFSRPGLLLWVTNFPPYSFTHSVQASNILEGWMTPPSGFVFPGDKVCHRYEFNIPPNAAFFQEGTPQSNRVYWLDVQAEVIGPQPFPRPRFGWKSCVTNWNDDAVWAPVVEPPFPPGPPPAVWRDLHFPPTHPRANQSVDLAFRINSGGGSEIIKWSQPPILAHNPSNWFNGWDEPSLYRIGPVIADDWLCVNPRPVSDIHWWGSFLNWTGTNLPPQAPVGFHFAIWRDVPQSPNQPFSHPGIVIWEQTISTTDAALSRAWVGWDIDPRTDCPEPESCFRFNYDIPQAKWFLQEPGTNIYWLSISAIYPGTDPGPNPFGWKTRPHVPVPPDDAVRIFEPLTPSVGLVFVNGQPIEYPQGVSWDMAFQLTSPPEIQENLDFGDAPEGTVAPLYPTRLVNNGARHMIVPGIFLGTNIDAEVDGQPNATATGDDLAGVPDDEDGVFFTSLLYPGFNATVRVIASAPGLLNAWIDFNGNGSWADPGDQIFTDVPLAPGVNDLIYAVPNTAVTLNTFSRFRFSSMPGLSYVGLAPDGEVEDYALQIQPIPIPLFDFDFGDAPHPPYPTLLPVGARHTAYPGFCLGTNIDTEPNGQPNAQATLDDATGVPDDEDGVTFITSLKRGSNACVDVFLTSIYGPARLDAWVDFNRNGVWDPAEQIFTGQLLAPGLNSGLCFPVPIGATVGRSFARFRMSSAGGLVPAGAAPNGEVEDYLVQICQRFPLTNVVITNITVLSNGVGHAITFKWNSEPDVAYQPQYATTLSNSPVVWIDVGPQIIGPANTFSETNAFLYERFYRVRVPEICP